MCRTQEVSFVERQTDLQRHYKEEPGDAWISDSARARSGNSRDPVRGEVELAGDAVTGRPYGVHRAVGGHHDAPNPGDLLSAALAACLHATLRMVAERLGVEILDSEVSATAHADVRGTLMVDSTVPVGFQHLHCDVRLKAAAHGQGRTLKMLIDGAEQCCVVFQTLRSATRVTTDWRIDEV